jgi:hypothetical protein
MVSVERLICRQDGVGKNRARLTEQDDVAGEDCGRQELGSPIDELQVVL